MSFRAGSLGFGDTLPLAEGRGKCENQLLRSPSWGRGWGEDAWERGRRPARRPAALMGLHSHSRPTEGSRCQQRVQRPGSEPQQKADTPEPSSLFPASSQRPKGHWGGNRLLEPGKQSHGPSERQGGGASQVLGPWGHEAAFAPDSNQGPGRMCREGRGQSWEESIKCPFLWYLETCEGRKYG